MPYFRCAARPHRGPSHQHRLAAERRHRRFRTPDRRDRSRAARRSRRRHRRGGEGPDRSACAGQPLARAAAVLRRFEAGADHGGSARRGHGNHRQLEDIDSAGPEQAVAGDVARFSARQIYDFIIGELRKIDPQGLLDPVFEQLDEIAEQVDSGLDQTVASFKRLQDALPSGGGGTSSSRSGESDTMPGPSANRHRAPRAPNRVPEMRDALARRIEDV